MSYEAWGNPPDPEPEFCPACGNETHEAGSDCPLHLMHQRALIAEQKNAHMMLALQAARVALDNVGLKDEYVDYEGIDRAKQLADTAIANAAAQPATSQAVEFKRICK